MLPRCPYCGGTDWTRAFAGFCDPDCRRLHTSLGRELVPIDDETLIERVHQYTTDRGAGYAATWDHLIGRALDQLEGSS